MTFLICGFGSFVLVQLVKQVLDFGHGRDSGAKLTLACLFSGGVAVAMQAPHYHVPWLIGYAFAGAGLAVLVHRVTRLLKASGDVTITEASERAARYLSGRR